jgi:signal transduction histidine kinase
LERLGRRGGMLTVMLTAYASLETAVSAVKLGAYDFLAKPFTPNELKAVVRKAAENLILARQARKLAEEKRQVRFQFISVLAHELKAPLNAVEGFLEIVRTQAAGDDPRAYVEMVERSIARLQQMRKLIADLLDLTRIESGQKSRNVTTTDLAAAAQTALETVLPDARERGLTVHLDCPRPLEMRADPGELDIILNNLLSNAVKYNRQGGEVWATVRADEQTVTLTVRDTGLGMTKEETAKLFGDFVRIKNKKTVGIPGSGLGLAVLKKLARLYDGDVTVDSTPDVGTTFAVTLKRSL